MSRTVIAIAASLLLFAPLAQGLDAPSVSAVFNGGFDLGLFPAQQAACLVFGDSAINVFQPGNPLDLPWLVSVTPCQAGAVKALGWSSSSLVQFPLREGDLVDHEARFANGPDDPALGSHNLWQAYPNPHQAFTGNFDALTFRVEAGQIPADAFVMISLSETPLSDVTPWVGLYVDCYLYFPASLLVPDANGVVRVSPADAYFGSYWEGCADELAAWNGASTEAGKRAVLDKLRIVQHSYWAFNHGSAPVVLDDIDLAGSRTVVQAAAGL